MSNDLETDTTKVKRKAGRPPGAKNRTTLLAEALHRQGVGRGARRMLVDARKLRRAEKKLNELLRDKSMTVNQSLFACLLVGAFNGIELPATLTEWEKRSIRSMIEDRALLQGLKAAVKADEQEQVTSYTSDREAEARAAEAQEAAKAFLANLRSRSVGQDVEGTDENQTN